MCTSAWSISLLSAFSFWKLTLFCFSMVLCQSTTMIGLLFFFLPVSFSKDPVGFASLASFSKDPVGLTVSFSKDPMVLSSLVSFSKDSVGLSFLVSFYKNPVGSSFLVSFPKTLLCPCWYPFPKAHPPYAPLPPISGVLLPILCPPPSPDLAFRSSLFQSWPSCLLQSSLGHLGPPLAFFLVVALGGR